MAKLTGYYEVAETVQSRGKYYYAIYEDQDCYKVGDKILVSGACHDILEIVGILRQKKLKEK